MTETAGTQREMGQDNDHYRFLTGAAMAPVAIRETHPAARFVARARLDPIGVHDEPVWGILLHDPGALAAEPDAARVAVVTDDGRRYTAIAPDRGRPTGEPAAILAAAKYWELPPAYIRSLPGGDRQDEPPG